MFKHEKEFRQALCDNSCGLMTYLALLREGQSDDAHYLAFFLGRAI
jgi:hypothetical protein